MQRCIKPNALKTPNLMDSSLVLRQLRYSGMMEVIRIRKDGYALRMDHLEFIREYGILSSGTCFEDMLSSLIGFLFCYLYIVVNNHSDIHFFHHNPS